MSKERGDLESLMRMALSGMAGAGDELSFGALGKYSDTARELKEENPTSATIGQVGSYFIPGAGVLGGARMAGKALGISGKALSKLASSPSGVGMLSKILKAAGVGATEGAIEAGGQTAIRNGLGTSQDDVGDSAKSGALVSGALRGLSPVAASAARNIYSHPAIFNPKSTKSQELMQKLMDDGVWGTEGTFRKYAEGAKKKHNDILDPYRKGISKQKADFDEVVGVGEKDGFAEREWNKKTTGSSALPQFAKTRQGAMDRLGLNPSMKKVQEYEKVLNEELATLAPQKRAEAISGVGGNASNEDQALGALKASIAALEKRKIGKKYGAKGLEDVKTAKASYGTGRELQRALDRPESLTQAVRDATPIPAVAGGVGSLGALVAGQTHPAALVAGLTTAGATALGRTLPGRTGMGVAANKFGRNPERVVREGARTTEMVNRTDQDSEAAPVEQDPFSQYVPPNTKAASKPVDSEERARSAKKFGLSNPDILAAIDDPNSEEKRKAGINAHKKVAPRQYKKKDDEENPFLKYVPSR